MTFFLVLLLYVSSLTQSPYSLFLMESLFEVPQAPTTQPLILTWSCHSCFKLQTSNPKKLRFQKPPKGYFSKFPGLGHWFAESQAVQNFARSSNEIGVSWNWNKLATKSRRKRKKFQQRMPPRRRGYTTAWRFGLCGHMSFWTTTSTS